MQNGGLVDRCGLSFKQIVLHPKKDVGPKKKSSVLLFTCPLVRYNLWNVMLGYRIYNVISA